MLRLVENHDWVIYSIFGCIVALVFALLSLNREVSLKDFLVQKYEDAANSYLTWLVVSAVFCVQASVLVSQYLPGVPQWLGQWSVAGYTANKFGYALLIVTLFYFIRNMLTFLFYSATGQDKNYHHLFFAASRLFFIASIIVMILNFVNYYIDTDKYFFLQVLFALTLFFFIFKQFFYLFNRLAVLPEEWYYKILYICTLQIVPVLVLWKVLFF